jgi:hypothetical protein
MNKNFITMRKHKYYSGDSPLIATLASLLHTTYSQLSMHGFPVCSLCAPFRAFATLWSACWVHAVRLSVCMKTSRTAGQIFMKFDSWEFYKELFSCCSFHLDQTILMITYITHMHSCAYLEHKSLNIYWSKKYFEQMLWKMCTEHKTSILFFREK